MEKIVFLAKGNCTLGRTTRDKDGNITNHTPAKFDFSSDGGCVVVGELNAETMAPTGSPNLYGDWQASEYLKKVLHLLAPKRKTNIPHIEAIVAAAKEDGVDVFSDFCHYCSGLSCPDCVVTELKEEL